MLWEKANQMVVWVDDTKYHFMHYAITFIGQSIVCISSKIAESKYNNGQIYEKIMLTFLWLISWINVKMAKLFEFSFRMLMKLPDRNIAFISPELNNFSSESFFSSLKVQIKENFL